MNIWKRVSLSAAAGSVAAIALLLFTLSTASAAGAGAISFTQTFHNAVQSFPSPNPCTGASGTVTLTFNGVFHVTELTSGQGAGTDWATGTMTGTFVFTPDDPTQPSFTGHFTTWFGQNDNLRNGVQTSTFALHGTGSDGSTLNFHEVTHLSFSASGITVSFDKPSCG
ncbi:MAG TPA: hypothetical protein VF026_16320 [Ktedonobacteraceae bacterium]